MQNEEKRKLYSYIEAMKDDMAKLNDYIFDNAEVGLEEFKSSAACCEWLEKEGFAVERGIADLPTAFRATYESGTGGPSIGLLVEYDALPNPNMPSGTWHACAHHNQPPILFATARALKNNLSDNFKIVVYGTPAEDNVGPKPDMIKAGCFKDIDVALMVHGWNHTTVDESNLACEERRVTFYGKTAHAAAGPEQGRSALDAAILTIAGLEFLREHTREDTRIHSTVVSGGGPANVVPAKAVAEFECRSMSSSYVDHVMERAMKVIEGACLMTETTYEAETILKMKNKIPSHILNDMLINDCRELGLRDVRPPKISRGSSDFGDVQYILPGFCLRYPLVSDGSSPHTQGFYEAGKTPETHALLVETAKVMTSVCYDLIKDPALMQRVKDEYAELQAAMN